MEEPADAAAREAASPAAAASGQQSAPESSMSLDDQIAAAEAQLEQQESVLRDWRSREAAEGGGKSAADQLTEARKRRDAARKAVQATQAKLSALQGARREKAKKLDKLLLKQQSMKAVTNPDQALPSMALRGGGDAELVKEIENLLRENRELEDAIGQHDATRLHLEKLQNEKKDVVRKVKELKGEEKVMIEQLEIKKAELQELQEQVKPSPVRARYEADVARLRKEISGYTAARTQAEREAAVHSKRLLRVRQVLGGVLKAEGLKPQDKLPMADDELAMRLANHIVGLAEKVRNLERAVSAREERAASLKASSSQAAEELKRLVARRGKEQRRMIAAPLPDTEALDGDAHLMADGATSVGPAGAAEQAAAGGQRPSKRAPPIPRRAPPLPSKGKAAAAGQKAGSRAPAAPTGAAAPDAAQESSDAEARTVAEHSEAHRIDE